MSSLLCSRDSVMSAGAYSRTTLAPTTASNRVTGAQDRSLDGSVRFAYPAFTPRSLAPFLHVNNNHLLSFLHARRHLIVIRGKGCHTQSRQWATCHDCTRLSSQPGLLPTSQPRSLDHASQLSLGREAAAASVITTLLRPSFPSSMPSRASLSQ